MSPEAAVISAPSLEELRRHVHRILCEQDRLDVEQTPLRQTVLRRSGRPCGMFFQVQGPRLLKAYAVWAGEEDRILFYDSSGVRRQEVRLSEAPDVSSIAA